MYNYILTRLAYRPVFLVLFVSGICVGSIIALLLALIDHSIGVLGAAFLAFLFALLSGFVGLIYTAVFNTVAPYLGGLPLKIELASPAPPDNEIIQPPDLPFY